MRAVAERNGVDGGGGHVLPERRRARHEHAHRGRARGVDAHYHKIHLYDAFGFSESRTVAPGFEPVLITVDGVGGRPDHLL